MTQSGEANDRFPNFRPIPECKSQSVKRLVQAIRIAVDETGLGLNCLHLGR
jgi:hypothetical protein